MREPVEEKTIPRNELLDEGARKDWPRNGPRSRDVETLVYMDFRVYSSRTEAPQG